MTARDSRPLDRPRSLTELALERLREDIVQGRLKLGQQVSEIQLAAQLEVSKTPVREALVQLKFEGLVDIHPQRGTFVFRLTPEQVGQLCRYRGMIETQALRDVMHGDPSALLADWRVGVKAMKRAEKARDLRALAALDMTFHGAILQHCPNEYLRAAYSISRYQLTALRHRSPIANAVESHEILLQALEAGDVEAACHELMSHILENEPRYVRACTER